MPEKVYDIFISYRRKDAKGNSNVATARTFYLKFDSLGYEVFFDYSECTDNVFSDKILPAIRTCRYFLLILTKDTLDRCKNEGDWVRREIEEALKYGRKIIPVTPDDNLFEGWPAGLPESFTPLTANGGVQVTTIHMGRMFDKTIEVLIDDRMGKPSPQKVNQVADTAAHCLKVRADIDCNVYIDDDPRGVAESGKVFRIPLSEGQYLLRFESCANTADSIEEAIDMPDKDILHPVTLMSIQQERERKEKKSAGERNWGRIIEPTEPLMHLQKNKKESVEFFIGGVDFRMVYVNGGTFFMGASQDQNDAAGNEFPAHIVKLSDYYIGETVVTNKLYHAAYGNKGIAPYQPGSFTWDNAQEFVARLSRMTGKTFRLPTEAEWEYAARGGIKSKGYKYSGSDNIDEVAWFDGNNSGNTHPVMRKSPNELGLYDMSGNGWEWCQDWYGDYLDIEQTNPLGPNMGTERVRRGGLGFANSCRVTSRGKAPTSYVVCGLRLAMSIE